MLKLSKVLRFVLACLCVCMITAAWTSKRTFFSTNVDKSKDTELKVNGGLKVQNLSTCVLRVNGPLSGEGLVCDSVTVNGATNIKDVKATDIIATGSFYGDDVQTKTLRVNGAMKADRLVCEKISVNGSVQVKDAKVTDVSVNGSFGGEDVQVAGSVSVNGSFKAANIAVTGDTKIAGSMSVKNGTMNRVQVAAMKATFERSKINQIVVKKGSYDFFGYNFRFSFSNLFGFGKQETQVLELKEGTVVSGDVVFEAGNGEVHLVGNSEIKGVVEGAVVVRV